LGEDLHVLLDRRVNVVKRLKPLGCAKAHPYNGAFKSSGGQSLIFVVVDLKNFQEAGKLQDLARRRTQAKKDESQIEVPASLEAFDQGGDTGAIDVANLAEVHDDARSALLANFAEKGFTDLGRVGEIDVS
jgi:hypothetical protein